MPDTVAADFSQLDTLLQASPAVLYSGSHDPRSRALCVDWVSTNLWALMGFRPEEACDPAWWTEHIHPDDLERVQVSFARLGKRREIYTEYRFRFRNTGYRWIRDHRRLCDPQVDGDCQVKGAWLDVTERREIQTRLHEREQLLRRLVETDMEGVLVVDAEGRIIEINPAGLGLLSCRDANEVIGNSLMHYVAPHHQKRFVLLARRAISGEPVNYEFDIRDTRGERLRVETRCSPLFDAHGQIRSVLIVARDSNRRSDAAYQAQYLAHYDMLTGLPNRALFRDRLLQSMAQARRSETLIAVMFLDMDNFKDVNDTLGHAVGDRLLKEVSARIVACTRETDTVARFGGDEFGVIQTSMHSVEDAAELAERIVDTVSQPIIIDNHEIHSAISIGLTLYPFDDHHNADELLKNADLAMYKAKREGRNRFQFYVAELNRIVQRRATIERDLRLALQRNEFTLHFQPQLSIDSGQVIGVEALLRWNQRERGAISPAEFIPVAESTGLIMEIGQWVLFEACRQVTEWQAAGLPPVRVAVNISPVQFRHRHLLDSIMHALHSSGVDPQLLEIELTESLIMRDADTTISTLRRLRELGVEVSVDDFGTGYSSLSYLTRFPINKIKLDQSFVRDIHKPDGAAIARTVITLGQTLDMRVMAEGVETYEQLAFLREHGCHEAQGFLFSRPMPGGAIQRLLTDSREDLRLRMLEPAF
ncbi:putative bifunctional diguanylate cyclase/phosphodiesterase [Thiohalobacter thiocyanaticus]|nr:EAL domain-containing protein [Thiohalobacter thiocyanaticus]